MIIRRYEEQVPFTTMDGSIIRSLLDLSNAPVARQSLAEASLVAGGETKRHCHRLSEEFYYVLDGDGVMEIDNEVRDLVAGDAVLIPAGAWHRISSRQGVRFLCCCSPPYSDEDTYFE